MTVIGVAQFAALFDASSRWVGTDTITAPSGTVRWRTFRHTNTKLQLFARAYPDYVLWLATKTPGFRGKQPPWEYGMGDYQMVTDTLASTAEHLRISERWTGK